MARQRPGQSGERRMAHKPRRIAVQQPSRRRGRIGCFARRGRIGCFARGGRENEERRDGKDQKADGKQYTQRA
ncbi:MAG: hypothetical protein IMF05_09465 [Proteobacteria bacterium]|nr:hypothetical protein [Pseudomonadota bacterium]